MLDSQVGVSVHVHSCKHGHIFKFCILIIVLSSKVYLVSASKSTSCRLFFIVNIAHTSLNIR